MKSVSNLGGAVNKPGAAVHPALSSQTQRRIFFCSLRQTDQKDVWRSGAKGTNATPFFSVLVREKRCRPPKRETLCGSTQLHFYLLFWKRQKEKHRRIDSAAESAAAYPARKVAPSTNLPKKRLKKLAEKQYWQVCASAASRKAQAAAVKEAHRFVYGNACFPKQKVAELHGFPQSGSLEPKRFKRRFAFFAAAGKEGRAGARNIFSHNAKNRRA